MKKLTTVLYLLVVSWASTGVLLAERASGPIFRARMADLSTDQADYAPGSAAGIAGSYFLPHETVTLQVLPGDGTPAGRTEHQPWTVEANAHGDFVTEWHVCEGDCVGMELRLVAVGQQSGLLATATFSDGKQGITAQASPSGQTSTQLQAWFNLSQQWGGTVQGSNSKYAENNSIPLRFTSSLSAGSKHTLLLKYDFSSGGSARFFDWLGSYDASVSNANVLSGISNAGASTQWPIPADNSLPAQAQIPGVLTTYNVSSVTFGSYTFVNGVKVLPVSFTVTGTGKSNFNVVLAYGGHLASANVWGQNNGSSQFPGASTKAYASFDGSSDMNVSVNPGAIVPSADLVLAKLATPEPVFSGSNLVYTLMVSNSGPNTASSVVVSDALPAGVTLISASGSQGTTTGSNPLSFNLGSLSAKATATITVLTRVLLSTDGVISNRANVASATLDPVSTNNIASVLSTVIDRNPPIIKCPADIVTSATAGQCGAVVDFAATATDDEPNLTITYSAQPKTFFAAGTNVVTCTATDPVGNSASCSFNVIILDQEPPQIACPADIVVNASPGLCSSNVTYSVTASDNCGQATVTCTPVSGAPFPVGTNVVNCLARDDAGNKSSCSFRVIVRDNQPPQFVTPASVIAQAEPNRCQATVNFASPLAIDQCDGIVKVTCVPPSGSTFAIGTNVVVCSATDSAGNTASCALLVIVQDPPNRSWPQAMTLSLADNLGLQQAAVQECLTTLDESRWFKFKVQPGSRIAVILTDLRENYDLVLFKDIGKAYKQLTSLDDLTHISAEFAGEAFSPSAFSSDAFSPSAFSPSAFSPSAFSPSAFSPSAFSPSAFSPSAFSPSAFSPDAFAPSAFSPSAFSPSAFSPSAFSPSAFSPSAFSPSAFSAAQIQSVVGVSAFDGTAGEGLLADTWDNDGYFYVRVRGRNGVFSPGNPFNLNVYLLPGACGKVNPVPVDASNNPLPPSTIQAPAGGYNTLILADLNRWLGTDSAGKAAAAAKLAALAQRQEVKGVVVDVGADPWVSFFNAQADANFDCVFAKNLVAGAIHDIVNRSRVGNALQYVVLVGDDSVIPFFRYPDQALLGPERNYVPPVKDLTPSQASLQLNYVLSQDAYGAACSLSLKVSDLPLADLAVGRLVETSAEVNGMIDAYLSTIDGVVQQPSTSLVTGYDFLADDANAVANELTLGIGTQVDKLICPNTTAPGLCWSADDLRQALFSKRHDIIFLAGHFSASDTLAADYTTHMLATELGSSSIDFRNSILFSAGCHSGYNIVIADGIPQVTLSPDWTRACAQKQATLVAGTGYQYGDTDFVEYSERLYLEFVQQLRTGAGAVSIGKALMNAKHVYLATTPELRGIHAKSYLEATLFGLPMFSVNMPGARRTASPVTPLVPAVQAVTSNPGLTFGLGFADVAIQPNLTPTTVTLNNTADGTQTTATYLMGGDGVVNNPAEPILPLEVRNVTIAGTVLRGVGFRGGTYTDLPNKVPLTGAPTTTIRGVHAAFLSEVFYPMCPWGANYFGALCGGIDGLTRLVVIPAQFKSDSATVATGTIRQFSEMDFRLYYDANIATFTDADGNVSTPALAAAPALSGIVGTTSPDGTKVALSARVVGNPSAGIQGAWVTFTAISGPNVGRWQSIDLAQDGTDSTLWTGVLPLNGTAPQEIRYMVQAVNGVGVVAIDTKFGAYHVPDEFDSGSTANLTATSLNLLPAPASGGYGSTVAFSARLTAAGGAALAGQRVVFSLSGQQLWATSDGNGIATGNLPLRSMPGDYALNVLFRGATGLSPSFTGGSFTITRQTTALTISPSLAYSKTNVNTPIIAQLTDGGGNPILERTVLFVVSGPNGAYGVPVTTDLNGKAPLGKVNLPDGTYNVSAFFNGAIPLPGQTIHVDDGIYAPSSATGPKLVVDDLPPIITCPANITKSSDASGIGAVVNYVTEATDDNPGVILTCSPPSGSVFPLGTTTVYCVATDSAGNQSSCSFSITVVDVQPPSIISVATSPGILWPPNHEMILVTINVVGTDNSGSFTSRITSVSSSDPTNTSGDGNTGGDWFVTGPLTLYLRAERTSAGVGRVYTITVTSTDAMGNVTNSKVTVTVPPNQI